MAVIQPLKTKTNAVPVVASGATSYDVVTPYQAQLQKKVPSAAFMVILLALVSITPGLANTSFNPAILEVAHEYSTDLSHIQALSSHYFFGMGIGQLLWGPISDRFGRRKTLIAASLLAVLINFIFINTQTYEQLELARLTQGLIFSAFGLLPTAILRDVYSSRAFIIYNSWVMILFLLAPAFAPIMGGYILITLTWRWIFTTISAIAVFAAIVYLFSIPETLDPKRRQTINPIKIVKNYFTIIRNPRSLICIILSGQIALVLFSWTAFSAAILIQDWGIPPQNIGYYSIGPVIFTIISNKLNGTLVKNMNPQKILVVSTYLQFFFAAVNLLVAWWFLGPWGLVIAQTCNALFTGFQNANLVSIYLMEYSNMIGTASSLYLSVRVIIPGILIYLVSFLPRHSGTTFLYFDAISIIVTLILVVVFNAVWPSPGTKMHKLRLKVLKRQRRKAPFKAFHIF